MDAVESLGKVVMLVCVGFRCVVEQVGWGNCQEAGIDEIGCGTFVGVGIETELIVFG
jgi:hypothetical protein